MPWERSRLRRHLYGLAGLIVFLLAWELLVASGLVVSSLLSPPSSIPATLTSEIRLGFWQKMILASLTHYSVGLLLGSTLGVVAGVSVALFPRFDAAQAWVARVLRPIPPLAWIPFAIIWFGITETAAAFIISVGIFWINYFTAMAAVQAVDKD